MLHPTAEFRKTLPAAPGGSSTRSTRIQASLSHTASGPFGPLRCFRRPTNEIRTCPDLLHLDLPRQVSKIFQGCVYGFPSTVARLDHLAIGVRIFPGHPATGLPSITTRWPPGHNQSHAR